MTAAQLTLDFAGTLPAPALPPWTGTPLRYHTAYATPAEHAAAIERWIEEHGTFGFIPRSHMWRAQLTARTVDGHVLQMLQADARRRGDEHDAALGSLVPDRLMYQANCEPCRWHVIVESENEAAEAWCDHAFPGWRDLPVMPERIRAQDWTKPGKAAVAWIAEHVPAEWQRPGSPARTARTGIATRHVPGGSPWFGYDMAVPA